MGLTSHSHVEKRLSMGIAVLLNTICGSYGFLFGCVYISCTVHLIIILMQYSLTVIPVNTNLPLTNNCTQCTVRADIANVYKIQLLSVQNNIYQNILSIH